jgi:hypothetical protein
MPMTPDESLRLATRVEGLFPDTTPEQVSFLADQFGPFDLAVVESELTRFRRQFETLSIANLLRRITDEQQKRTIRPRTDRHQIDAEWQKNDATVARLSDEELHRHKESILNEKPDLRKFLADKDPRQSVILRSLILDKRLKQHSD